MFIECVPLALSLQTIENTRELVEDTPRTAEEVAAAEADDEFADHFARARAPKVLVTTCYRPTAAMYRFLTELLQACCLWIGLYGNAYDANSSLTAAAHVDILKLPC